MMHKGYFYLFPFISISLILLLLSGCFTHTRADGNQLVTPKIAATLEPYKINLYFPGAGTQKDTEFIEKEASKLLEDINVNLRIYNIGSSDWQTKKRMLLNSAEKADLVFTASWDEYFQEVGRDDWLPLNDLLDQYGQDIKENLSEEQLKAAMVNGQLYAIPVNKEFGAVYGLLFNKKIVDRYSIDIKKIQSLNDLESLLAIIKLKEPDITPFLLDGYGTPLRIVYMNSYEVIGSDTSAGAIKKAGTDYIVLNQYEQDDMKQAAQLVYDWNKAGYFNYFTLEHQPISDELKRQDNYFCLMSPIKPGKDKEMTQQYGIEFVQHSWQKPYADTRECTAAMMAIPRNCKDPERTMMFLNRLYTDKKLVNLIVNGIEDKHYVKVSDNIIDFPTGTNLSNSGYFPMNNWKIGSQFLDYIWNGEDPSKWDNFKEYNIQSEKSRIMGFTYNAEAVGITENKVTEVIAKYFTLYSNGHLNPEESYASFMLELKKAGVDQLINEKQNQLNKWLETNN